LCFHGFAQIILAISCLLTAISANFGQTHRLTVIEFIKNQKPAHHILASRHHMVQLREARSIQEQGQEEEEVGPSYPSYYSGNISKSNPFSPLRWLFLIPKSAM
jgi:hypothetical protein